MSTRAYAHKRACVVCVNLALSAKHPTQTIANPPSTLEGQCYCPHFRAKETEVQRGMDLPKVTDIVHGYQPRPTWLRGALWSPNSKTPLQVSASDIQSQPSYPPEHTPRAFSTTLLERGLHPFRPSLASPKYPAPVGVRGRGASPPPCLTSDNMAWVL